MPMQVTPRQLQELLTGERVDIFYGNTPESRQTIFTNGVPMKILTYFSAYCRQKLEKEGHRSLSFGAGGSKNVLQFAFNWMCAGGWDAHRVMPSMDANTLVDLHRLAIHLEVPGLIDESGKRLGAAIHHLSLHDGLNFHRRVKKFNLQFVDDKVESRLLYLVRHTILGPTHMKMIYESTTEDSKVRAAAVKKLAMAVVHNEQDPSVFEEYCVQNPQFNDDMIKATPTRCSNCHKFGHLVEGCFKLHPELIPKKPHPEKQPSPKPSRVNASNRQRSPVSSHYTVVYLADYIKPAKGSRNNRRF